MEDSRAWQTNTAKDVIQACNNICTASSAHKWINEEKSKGDQWMDGSVIAYGHEWTDGSSNSR